MPARALPTGTQLQVEDGHQTAGFPGRVDDFGVHVGALEVRRPELAGNQAQHALAVQQEPVAAVVPLAVQSQADAAAVEVHRAGDAIQRAGIGE